MPLTRLIPLLLLFGLLGAHFFRAGEPGLLTVCLLTPLLLLVRRRWAARLVQAALLAGGAVWADTLGVLIRVRVATGQPWLRLAVILGGVALLTAAGALLLQGAPLRRRYPADAVPARASLVAFGLVAGGLTAAHLASPLRLVVLERFWPGFGALEILALGVYAAWLTRQILSPGRSAVWRRRLWRLFSVVFFVQLSLGVAGVEELLLSGELHWPVPAVILAGPLYRGEGLFMAILFGVTLLLVGPAWCSFLCYLGPWDDLAARRRRLPQPLPAWRHGARLAVLLLAVLLPLGLRLAGLPPRAAGVGVAVFWGLGLGIMVLWSRRSGTMVHCLLWCPIGLLANLLGKLSPWRVRVLPGCTGCHACLAACRYDALSPATLAQGRPGLSCTLCGDCLPRCHTGRLAYTFPGLGPATARVAFLTLAVSLHALFLGLGMI
ncbi:MAG: 4Fe-4S binding protein [Myxococcota bacterium]|nr:4Fe-4S binding protein [Myxococcota bacterium]